MRWGVATLLSGFVLSPLVVLIAGEPRQAPPRGLWFEGLPVQGSLADAQRAGFTDCTTVSRFVRCRRDGLMLRGKGPYHAAVDVLYDDGSGGFRELVVWKDGEQTGGVNTVGDVFAKEGWTLCRTGEEFRGDQEIYTKAGSSVRVSVDISYWGKRRLRILPELNQPMGKCW